MKKLFIIAFSAAFSALALAACDGMGGKSSDTKTDSLAVETIYDIAYVDLDSLKMGYNRAVDLTAAFEAKATKTQKDLEARARRLQNEMMDFQEKIDKGLVTRSQAAELQAELERKSMNFENTRQQKTTEIMEEESVTVNQIMYAITEYLKKYNSDYRYKMILTTSGGMPILHASPSLDVTREVLEGLNAEYAAEQKNKKEEK
jgi:outer membrane protein